MTTEAPQRLDASASSARARCGSSANAAVWFVDIKRQHVHPTIRSPAATRAGTRPSRSAGCCPARSGGFVAGLQDGLYTFDPASRRLRPHGRGRARAGRQPPQRRRHRSVGPRLVRLDGRCREGAKSGRFYVFDRGEIAPPARRDRDHQRPGRLARTAGMLYFLDTLGGKIMVCDMRARTASARPVAPLRADLPKDAYPDGRSSMPRTMSGSASTSAGKRALLARRRAGRAVTIPGRQHHQDGVRRSGPADRLRHHRRPRTWKPEAASRNTPRPAACSSSRVDVPGISCPLSRRMIRRGDRSGIAAVPAAAARRPVTIAPIWTDHAVIQRGRPIQSRARPRRAKRSPSRSARAVRETRADARAAGRSTCRR